VIQAVTQEIISIQLFGIWFVAIYIESKKNRQLTNDWETRLKSPSRWRSRCPNPCGCWSPEQSRIRCRQEATFQELGRSGTGRWRCGDVDHRRRNKSWENEEKQADRRHGDNQRHNYRLYRSRWYSEKWCWISTVKSMKLSTKWERLFQLANGTTLRNTTQYSLAWLYKTKSGLLRRLSWTFCVSS